MADGVTPASRCALSIVRCLQDVSCTVAVQFVLLVPTSNFVFDHSD